MYIKHFDRFFSPLQWQVLRKVAQIADELNLRAFAVGGIVRDAVVRECVDSFKLDHLKTTAFPKDLDLVFDGAEQAGIKVAIALQRAFPEAKLQIHEKFQTAELLWQDFAMDMATARQETYAYAGANPEVIATTLKDDLERRDFTINALAVQLDSELGTRGEIIDRFKGLQDLANRQVRAIRAGSFEEDPRRLFRAARFATRLNLAIAPETYAEIIATTASGLHDAIGGARLRAELHYTLAESRASQMFALLQDLGALRCIHPDLRLPDDGANTRSNTFKYQWRRSQYWLKLINRLENSPSSKNHAQINAQINALNPINLGVELLLSYLSPQISTQLDLGFSPEQKTRQIKLAELLANVSDLTNKSLKNSEITQNLQKFDLQTLILAGVKCQPFQRRIIWRYLTQWRRIKSPLTGIDLQGLGYASGKQMGEILQKLRGATLDGEITNQEEAISYLRLPH
ncbi:CCA tRNA nucleotidyltransferase [Pseudanabaena sp. FACHB-1998]|uniref:CCA tRNA nucleotidyltransferase n=1 Tax=Pseudanabaena sp. FACHB-1998 TaxID=2692858 RepID=UPI001680649B|nr:CCA tRNA nucleotidyltransferase [Pseudanabaena sp. FACHB-1998]MBD2177737.1 CCA tRNA nucleotidyltransferase [Pseudanabaena sp. FACHB-1998]